MPTPATPASLRLTIISFVSFTFIGYFAIGLPLAVLPVYIHHTLGYSAMIAGIVISLQYLTTFLFRGYAGKIVDTKGPKLAVLLSMTGFAISGALLLLTLLLQQYRTASLILLIITRLVTGFSEGMIGASPINWAIFSVGSQHTAKAISFNGIASYGALAAGAPLGVILSNNLGIASIGIATTILGTVGLLYARNKTNIRGSNIEGAHQSFWHVLKKVAPYGLCLATGGLGFGTISTFITLYYAYLHWQGAVLCLSVFSAMFVIGRLIFARAIDVYGGIRTAMASLTIEALGLLILWLATTPHLALTGAGIAGLGFSLVFPALGVEAVRRVPASSQGAALGNYGLFIDLSLGITGPLIGAVATRLGMQYILPFSITIVLIGIALSAILYTKRKKTIPQ